MPKKKLLYLITEDWFFCSHFLERAVAAREAGYAVTVLANEGSHARKIRSAGLEFIALPFRRRSVNPFAALGICARVWRIYRALKPDVVHHVGMKPILFGSLAARLLRIRNIVNAPVGMGYVFSSGDRLARILKPMVAFALDKLLNPRGSKVVFENQDDLDHFVAQGVVARDAAVLVRGAGVDTLLFRPTAEPAPPLVVALCARMLRDKGVHEFVEAARALQDLDARFWLVGAPDAGNPAAIPEAQLRAWHDEGVIQWQGHTEDMPALLGHVHVACLPSYREGLPKALIEALAAGKPVVTTDVPGCREVVRHEWNGLLVPAKNARALAAALRRLLEDGGLRAAYGSRGREMAEQAFSSAIVGRATLDLYASFRLA